MTQVLFGGNTEGAIPDGEYIVSDSVSVYIPNGALFCVRIFWESTTGVLSTVVSLNLIANSGFETGVSGINDETMAGSVTASSTNFPPCAIIGTTDQPSFAIVGDSIGYGQGDGQDVGGDYGYIMKALGPRYAYVNMCRSGDQADKFVLSSTNRAGLFQYTSHLVCEYGTNDMYTLGDDATETLTNLQTIWGLHDGVVYQTTILPRATSSDDHITLDNQTVTNGNTERFALNESIRTSTDIAGYFETADVVEELRSGKWIPGQIADQYTNDGTHPVAVGHAKLRDSGQITPLTPQGGHGVLMPAAGPVQDSRRLNINSKAILTPIGL
jgi:lysophospholipase L1-like esterase